MSPRSAAAAISSGKPLLITFRFIFWFSVIVRFRSGNRCWLLARRMEATRHGDFLLIEQEALLRRSCLFAVHKKAGP